MPKHEDNSIRQLPTVIVRLKGPGEELFLHKARNISTEGMFIDAPLPLSVGAPLQLEFRLPEGELFSCQAEVQWNTDSAAESHPVPHPGMSVAFKTLSAEQIVLLQGFALKG